MQPGACACLGRKYVFSLVFRRYKTTVDLNEEPQFVGEMFEERKSRILPVHQDLTYYWIVDALDGRS